MTYQQILDAALDFIQCFHEGEVFHISYVNKAERCVFYVDSGLVKHYVWFKRDGMTEWGTV